MRSAGPVPDAPEGEAVNAAAFFLWVTFVGLVGLALAFVAAVVLGARRREPLFPTFEEYRREQAENARLAHRYEGWPMLDEARREIENGLDGLNRDTTASQSMSENVRS